jgi:hypothetical protein
MGELYQLPETMSSWSTDFEVVKKFKGGVAPKHKKRLSAIFRITPTPDQVVLNLNTLYADPEFVAACDRYKSQIPEFDRGIGRWKDDQAEVILRIGVIRMVDVYAVGGYAHRPEEVLHQPHVQRVLAVKYPGVDRSVLENLARRNPRLFGPRWITGEAKERTLRNWIAFTRHVKAKYGR